MNGLVPICGEGAQQLVGDAIWAWLFVFRQVFDAGLIGGGFHDEGGEFGGGLLGLGSGFQLDGVWAFGFPRAMLAGGVPCGWEVLASFRVAWWGHHFRHVVGEEVEDAFRAGVEQALFVVDGHWGAWVRAVAEGYPVGQLGLVAEAGSGGGVSFEALVFYLLVLYSSQVVVGGEDLVFQLVSPLLEGVSPGRQAL